MSLSSPTSFAGSGRNLIAILGSSSAAGVGPRDGRAAWAHRYGAHLQVNHPGWAIASLAVGGYMTFHAMPTGSKPPPGRPAPVPAHNITQALSLHPRVLILSFPTNDIAGGISPAEQMANLERLASDAAGQGVDVWLTSVQPRNLPPDRMAELQKLRRLMAAKFGRKVVDFYTGLARADGGVKPEFDSGDGCHLNDEAHGIFFTRLVAARLVAGGK